MGARYALNLLKIKNIYMKHYTASVLTIGEEILYGHILDTNANFISHSLADIGIKVVMHLSVGDHFTDITAALKTAEEKSDLVLMTGGLGPTNDDITKKCLAAYFNSRIKMNDKLYNDLETYFKKRGFPFTVSNQRQAEVPENAELLSNEMGTAPGMWFEKEGKIFVSMPGVPHEMEFLMTEKVIPKIRKIYQTSIIYHKLIMTAGMGESWLSEKIRNWEESLPEALSLAYLPSYGQVKLRITARGNDRQQLIDKVELYKASLKDYIGKYIYGEDGVTIQEAIGKILKSRNQTLSIAESCTGGYLSHQITTIPGASDYFQGSVLAYSNIIKQRVLHVRKDTIEKYGAVSRETVIEMAQGILDFYGTDYALATSGIAGPGGGTEEKPVGTIWIAIADKGDIITKKYTILKDRISNIKYASTAALVMLWQRLSEKN
jgi:nicotinamide-nucleotide amidase